MNLVPNLLLQPFMHFVFLDVFNLPGGHGHTEVVHYLLVLGAQGYKTSVLKKMLPSKHARIKYLF